MTDAPWWTGCVEALRNNGWEVRPIDPDPGSKEYEAGWKAGHSAAAALDVERASGDTALREARAAALAEVQAALYASASRVIREGDASRATAWVGIRKWASDIIAALERE